MGEDGIPFKRRDPVSIPMKQDLSLEVADNVGKEAKSYRLTGIVSHVGTNFAHGHYVYDDHLDDGSWTCFDDSTVTKNKKEVQLSRKHDAYIVVYSALQ